MKINCHFKLAAAILLLLTGVGSAVGAISTVEREALIALYNSTIGDNWTNNKNWLDPPGTEGSWYGVIVEGNSVAGLSLENNQLSGSIPPELENLTKLEVLDLRANQLSGSIPPQLKNLTKLTVLDLRANQLSGSIPSQLKNLTELDVLDLRTNQLSGSIPPELGNLTKLMLLGLGENQLSGSIPHELGDLTKLTVLDLHANQLSGSIPPELGDLTKLEVFDLRVNQISGYIPPELGNLRYLVKLDLRADQNPCFFYIGAIKTIAGIKPSTELFDIFIKFNYWKGTFSFASVDFAFTEKTDDEAAVKPRNLTEAGFSFNFDLNKLLKLQDRHMFLGFSTKVFDNDPYYGVHFGSFETNDTLFSSYFMVGYLRRWYRINQKENAILDKKEFKQNLFIEFALHSQKLPFIQNIRLKGGILLPFQDRTGIPNENDIKVRIVIEIPIGKVIRF